MKRGRIEAGLALAAMLMWGCDLPMPGPEHERIGGDTGGVLAEGSAYFSTGSGGEVVFETNERKYVRSGGYTFWYREGNTPGAFTAMEKELIKESGDSGGGYGYFFKEGMVAGYGQCMLTVMIRTTGDYAVGKVVDGAYRNIVWWKKGSTLTSGYGAGNRVKVEWDGAAQEYALEINGQEAARFTDSQEPACTGTGYGYIAVITGNEKFPAVPVKARYR
jgi:hypothetical protein